MSQSPLFTVIIPTHNRPRLLRRAVRSVMDQEWTDWEGIIVDDGSDPAVDPGALPADRRISLLRQSPSGPAAARKLGLEQARGRYVCFLDDDDFFFPDHLGRLADHLRTRNYPETVLRLPLGPVHETATAPVDPEAIARPRPYPAYSNDSDALHQYWAAPCGLTSLCFPLGVRERYPIDPAVRAIEDFEWVSRVLTLFPFRQLAGPVSVAYVQHPGNRSLTDRQLEDRLNVVRTAYERPGINQRVPSRLRDRLLQHQLCHAARQCALVNERARGWGYVRRALRFFPYGLLDLGRAAWMLLR